MAAVVNGDPHRVLGWRHPGPAGPVLDRVRSVPAAARGAGRHPGALDRLDLVADQAIFVTSDWASGFFADLLARTGERCAADRDRAVDIDLVVPARTGVLAARQARRRLAQAGRGQLVGVSCASALGPVITTSLRQFDLRRPLGIVSLALAVAGLPASHVEPLRAAPGAADEPIVWRPVLMHRDARLRRCVRHAIAHLVRRRNGTCAGGQALVGAGDRARRRHVLDCGPQRRHGRVRARARRGGRSVGDRTDDRDRGGAAALWLLAALGLLLHPWAKARA